MSDPDPDPSTPSFPWVCRGHLQPELPVELDGTTLSSQTDFDALVDTILSGWSPYSPNNAVYDGPAYWLVRLYAYLLGLPEADALSEAISRRATDTDPEVFGRVLFFFSKFPTAKGINAPVDVAVGQADRCAVGYAIAESSLPQTTLDLIAAYLNTRHEPSRELDEVALNTFKSTLLKPLSDLSREIIGQTRPDREEAQTLAASGELNDFDKVYFDSQRKLIESERLDVPIKILKHLNLNTAFDASDCLWLADNIVEIEEAGSGRWKIVLRRLLGLYRADPDAFSHLLVIGATRIIQSGLVGLDEIRGWVNRYNRSSEEWVLPVTMTLDTRAKEQLEVVK